MRYFEDMEIGKTTECGIYEVTEKNISEFAAKWDPAYFHLDKNKAEQSIYGGLIASGAHLFSIFYMLSYRIGETQEPMDARATLGFEVKYPNPARPGDDLTLFTTPIEKRDSKSMSDAGITRSRSTLENQKRVVVLDIVLTGLYGKRPAEGSTPD